MTTFKEQAAAAWQKRQADDAEVAQEKLERQARRALAKFNTLGSEIAPHRIEGASVFVENMELICADDIVLMGVCPDCGKRLRSLPIYSMADLGEMFAAFKPEYHSCFGVFTAPASDDTPEARLIAALRDLLAEIRDADNW